MVTFADFLSAEVIEFPVESTVLYEYGYSKNIAVSLLTIEDQSIPWDYAYIKFEP